VASKVTSFSLLPVYFFALHKLKALELQSMAGFLFAFFSEK